MTMVHAVAVVLLTHFGVVGAKLLVALFALDLGASPLEVGFVYALFSLLPAVLALTAGRWVDRVGVRAPLTIGCGTVAVSIGALWLTPGLWALYPAAVVIGVGFLLYAIAGQSLVGAVSDPTTRTRNFSYYALAVSMGGVFARASTGVAIDLAGHRAAALMLAAAPLAAFALVLWLRRRMPAAPPAHAARASTSVADLWRIPALRRALIAAAVIESGNELFALFVPLYGTQLGLSATAIGFVLAAYAAASFAVRIGLPALVSRFGEERVLCAALFGAAATGTAMIATGNPGALMALSAAYGLTLGCGMPLTMALTYARAPQGRVAEAIGLRQTVNKSIEVAVPIGFGAIAGVAGVLPLAVAMGVFLASGAAVIARDARRRPAPGQPSSD
jgi:MFS family permease